MATLLELHTLFFDEPLRNKIQAGLFIIGHEILSGADTAPPYSQEAGAIAARRKWAAYMVQNADSLGAAMRVLLGGNAGLAPEQIQNAPDTAVLGAIRAAADGLAKVYA
ncbi:MAG: hypothetical protein KF770_17520 [Anaerolineae bacterium]|nr:hypothetical protein [Anaerolineae bacterium]